MRISCASCAAFTVRCEGGKDLAKLGRSCDEMLTFSLSRLSLEEGRAAVGEETTGQHPHDGSVDSWPVDAMPPEQSGELEEAFEAHTGGLILLFLILRAC